MATFFERLGRNVPDEERNDLDTIGVLGFWAALVGLADGQFTRTQIENKFNIETSGTDKAQLDAIITGYQNAVNKPRYLSAVLALFILMEQGVRLTNAQITQWLTAAQADY